MDSLPYRATIFMRPVGLHCGQLEMMERNFAQESDAVFWCKVMSEADSRATGVWLVAVSKGGRVLSVTREEGLSLANGLGVSVATTDLTANRLDAVLGGAGLSAEPSLAEHPAKLSLVGSA